MMKAFQSFLRDESGATAIEYGLIAALIFVTIVTGVTLVADGMDAKYDAISEGVTSSM